MLKKSQLLIQLIWMFACLSFSLEADWLPPVNISEHGNFPATTPYGNPDVAIDSNGNVVAVWYDQDTGFVMSATKAFNTSTWDSPEVVSGSFSAGGRVWPRVVVDGSGNAVAVWSTGQAFIADAPGVIQANILPFGGSWGSPVDLSATASVGGVKVSINAAGFGVAVWSNTTQEAIQASTLSAGVWSPAEDISGIGDRVVHPDVVVDSAGNATAVWLNSTTVEIESNVLPFGGSWGVSPMTVGPGPLSAVSGGPSIDVDGAGTAYAVWFNNSFVRSSQLPLSGSWSAPIPISTAALILTPDIAVTPSGEAVAVWFHGGQGAGSIDANFFNGTTWASPVSISGDVVQTVLSPQVDTDDAGNFTAVWYNQTTGFIQSNIKAASGTNTWGSPVNISNGTTDTFPQISVNSSGSAEVVWVSTGTGFIQATGRSVEVTDLNPSHGPATGGNPVQIIGTGFENVTDVLFDGVSIAFVVNTANLITVTAPAGVAGDSVQVVVVTTTGQSTESPHSLYSYDIPPEVTGLNPSSGPTSGGNTVTVTGIGFGSTVLSVTVGGVSVSFTVVSPTELTITMPPGSQGEQVQVIVTTMIGSSPPGPASLYTYFTLNPPTNFTGKQVSDIFVTQKAINNQLSWTKSTSPNVVAYQIYRNGQLIATLPSTETSYTDPNQINKAVVEYTIFAVDAQGGRSSGTTIIVS